MSGVQRTDITVTVEEWLSRHFAGQVVLWLGDHIKDLHFITSLTLWIVKVLSRTLEPLLLFCAAYLMISMSIKSLINPGMHDFSLSVLIGAPDIILPGGAVTVWQKFGKQAYVSASVLSVLLIAMAVLTGYANADVFGVIKLPASQISQLLFWRAMIGMTYSTTVITTLLTKHQAHEETVRRPSVHAQIDTLRASLAEQQRTHSEQNVHLITELANTTNQRLAQVTEQVSEQFRSFEATFTEQFQSVTEQLTGFKDSPVGSCEVEQHGANIRPLPRTKTNETGPNTITAILDKGSFVRQCLRDHPNIRNSEIQRKASEQNLTISPGYISDIRKAFSTEHEALESKAVQ